MQLITVCVRARVWGGGGVETSETLCIINKLRFNFLIVALSRMCFGLSMFSINCAPPSSPLPQTIENTP
jgi:hypothetical protein